MNLQPYLDFATSLAYRAGRITMGYYNTGVRADMKENNEPVTIADHEAEKFIRAEIERQYPGHAIIGEEFGHTNGNGVPFRWTIDPIDGTKSFIRSVPLYGVLIGLEIEGKISVVPHDFGENAFDAALHGIRRRCHYITIIIQT